MNRLLMFLAGLSCAGPPAALGEPYWVEFEPEAGFFPEEVGWTRISYGDAERWIVDSTLVIDSRGSSSWVEFYQLSMDGALDPGPGEQFVMQWRMRVQEVIGPRDPGVSVFSDTQWAIAFTYDLGTVTSVFEPGVSAAFEPEVFHDYELRSADMLTYELLIDGALAISGSSWLSLNASRVGWGDVVQGGASLVDWDYMRFGVLPEPDGVTAGVLLWIYLASRRRAATG
jgi:hypothetical protein